MLLQRVITALVLLAVLLPAMWVTRAWPFAVLTLVAIAAAGWEWGRLNGASSAGAVAMGGLLAAACGAALALGAVRAEAAHPVWWLAVLLWVLGGAWAIKAGPEGWPRLSRAGRWAIGLIALWTAWLALATAKAVGLNFLLSVFCLVWVADIAAYFGGRAFGRRKLAPAISPGKSWEGVWSGMVGVVALAFAWMAAERHFVIAEPSVYSLLSERLGSAGLVLALIFLAAMSVVGDLTESLVKRAAGAKDSSRLLPGHGGVLDRIDALVPVFPIAMALSFF